MTRETGTETYHAGSVHIGKDLLELVSSAMYVEPLTAYREYIQNAADAIDEARAVGLIPPNERGKVEITLERASRTVRIRDNGIAVPAHLIIDRLLAIGGSAKRGTKARGFRGVGRLAALGYAQTLTFRSRAQGERRISQVRWDGRTLRRALAESKPLGLAELVAEVAQISEFDGEGFPERFFEVEIERIARQRGDRLLSPEAVEAYLSQVAPLAFDDGFRHRGDIEAALRAVGALSEIDVSIDGAPALRRPHRDTIGSDGDASAISDVEIIEVPGTDGGIAAVGWFAHHDYRGAVPTGSQVKGVRVRVGNIQVGDHRILEQIFPEGRFNAWSVGEVHILDRRIVPNGRRDEFEANTHHANLINHLSPLGREIARRCRTSSSLRSKLKAAKGALAEAEERLGLVRQGALSQAARQAELARVAVLVSKVKKAAEAPAIPERTGQELGSAAIRLEGLVKELSDRAVPDPLELLDEAERPTFRAVFDLIYECSPNRIAAKKLVDRILERLAA